VSDRSIFARSFILGSELSEDTKKGVGVMMQQKCYRPTVSPQKAFDPNSMSLHRALSGAQRKPRVYNIKR
jgi:hypothetical protein